VNWLLRKIFGPKREEVTRGWRKLYNEDFIIYAVQIKEAVACD
jgi:hypothetical protein